MNIIINFHRRNINKIMPKFILYKMPRKHSYNFIKLLNSLFEIKKQNEQHIWNKTLKKPHLYC